MKTLMAAAAIAATLFTTPAQAAPDYADVLARVIPDDPPAKRIDPWAVERPQFRPVDGWARADVISPKHLAAIRHAAILEREAEEHVVPAEPAPVAPVVDDVHAATTTGTADWNQVVSCEASGNWGLVTTGNGYYFALQFKPSTWLSNGGTQAELDAGVAPSPGRLIEVAESVLASQGPGAWPNCFAYA